MFTSTVKACAAVGAALAMVLLGAPSIAAPAAYHHPQVAWTGKNVHVSPDGSKAFVIGKYRCWGGRTGTHLWVSVKQGPGLSEPDHTGSSNADAWFDTNWNFQNSEAGLTVPCDGHWHVTRYTLKQEFGTLHDGKAYVQFCLFDNTGTEDNFPQGFAQVYGWRTVRVP
jgi:hypothetical protein